jgi:hypothetical protein
MRVCASCDEGVVEGINPECTERVRTINAQLAMWEVKRKVFYEPVVHPTSIWTLSNISGQRV